MKIIALVAALAVASAFAFNASAFTPVVTALPAFSFFSIQNIQRNFGMGRLFCSRCGQSGNVDSRGRPVRGGQTAYDPYFDNPNRH